MNRFCGRFGMLVALLAFALVGTGAHAETESRVTVSGDAQVNVRPDEVTLTLGIETSDKDLEKAKDLNDRRLRRVVENVERLGVPSKYIQTDFLHIQPRYEHTYRPEGFVGYFVRRTVTIRVRKIESFEAILSSALESGANYVHGVDFRTTELRRYRDQARVEAVRAARDKAKLLAGEAGLKVGKAVSINESPSWWGSSYHAHWGAGRRAMSQNVFQNTSAGAGAVEGLSAGMIAITARVTVTFELKKE